jgi:hypothetical protein
MNDIIKFKPCELRYQKNIEDINCEIQLLGTYVKISYNFYADEPNIREDADSGWNTEENNYEVVLLRKQILSIERNYLYREGVWGIYLFTANNCCNIFVKTKKEVDIIYNAIVDYLI